MQRVTLSDEDVDHIRKWQKLTSAQREAINDWAEVFGDPEKKESLYNLIKLQSKLSALVAVSDHVGWFTRMFLKAGVIATTLIAFATFIKVFFGGK